MKQRRPLRKVLFAAVLAVVLAAMIVATAFAAGETGVTLTGFSLSGGAITFSDFSGVTLNGQLQTTTATWNIADVVDSRGTGEGWNLSLTLTQLQEYDTDHYVVSGHTIPTSSITVTTAPVVSLADGTSSPANTITVVATSTALDTGSPVKLLSAATDGGMGSYHVSDLTATLAIRADAYAGTYKTDATVALVSGP